MENKKVIGVAQVLQHLKDGMTRDDIAQHYGISKSECKLLFQHPDLKGKKTIKKPSFVIVADATAEIEVNEEETVEETQETETTDNVEATEDNSQEEDSKEEEVEETSEENETETEEESQEEEVIEPAKATWGD